MGFVGLMATATYAYTDTNTVPVSAAGNGSGVISGYTATNITYTLNATDPTLITKVTFGLTAPTGANAPASTNVKAKLVSTGTTYNSCSLVSGTTWDCTLGSGVAVTAANSLTIIAAQ
jgi:hypothetical protein